MALKPWVGPAGTRPITMNPVQNHEMLPGRYLIVKVRDSREQEAEVAAGGRVVSPFEVCRIRDDPAVPVTPWEHIGESTQLPVEFLYPDR